MNGGQNATRGLLLQTLIALLDVLATVEKIDTLILEPATDKDKTDYVIEYVDGRKKAVQVKSSKNQIGLKDAKNWAKLLKNDLTADEYELRLIGPISGDLAKQTELEGVAIPSPKSLDLEGMLHQAAHQIDLYLDKNSMASGSPHVREHIVEALIGKLSTYSTSGTPLPRSDLETVFRNWVEIEEQNAHQVLKTKYGNGTLTDEDALREYAAQFDRPALQDPFPCCWNYDSFGDALSKLIELLKTGTAKGRFVTKRHSDFVNLKWRATLKEVYHEIRELRNLFVTLVTSGDIDRTKCGCKCSQEIVNNFEDRKSRIIRLLNQILAEADIELVKGVR